MCLNRYLFKCWRFYLACAIGALLLSATDAPAATITVTNGNDSGPGSLRQAMLSAASGDTINFAPSVTIVTLTSAELVIDKNLTTIGPGADRLTVRVKPPPGFVSFRGFNISSSTATVSISGITISNGFAQFGTGGGGILSAGVLTLTGCTISGNFAGSDFGAGGGGGVMNDNGTMTITGCTISNNQEAGGQGGGGVLNENGTMTITGCTISNNSASGIAFALIFTSEGGGILNDLGSLIITNSTISGNTCFASGGDPFFPQFASTFGGGVDNSGSMTITNCTISGNSSVATGDVTVDTAYGGGISNGAIFKLRAVPSHIILHQVISESVVGLVDLSQRQQTAVS